MVGTSLATLKRVCTVLGVSSDRILFGHAKEDRAAHLADKCRDLTDKQFSILVEIVDKYIEAVTKQ